MNFKLTPFFLIFFSLAIAQPKTIEFEFTNRTDYKLNSLYIYSKWDKSKGKNFLEGKILKPNEKVTVSVFVEKKSRCKKTIHISDEQGHKVIFPGFSPCKDGNVGLAIFSGMAILTEEN